jgi:hypothetical protein
MPTIMTVKFEPKLPPQLTLSGFTYDSVSYAATTGNATGMTFNPDGTKLFAVGRTGNTVSQHTLSTPFDLTTASNDSSDFSVSSQSSGTRGLYIDASGTRMYVIDESSDRVYQYSMSSGFDLSTASYDSKSFDFSSQEGNPSGLSFKTDGTKMYITGFTSDDVHQYTLSTPWDVSTASYDSVSFSIGSQEAAPFDMFIGDGGARMFIVGTGTDSAYQYTLSTPWDVSTASYDSISFDLSGQMDDPSAVYLSSDATKMFVLWFDNGRVYQYSR